MGRRFLTLGIRSLVMWKLPSSFHALRHSSSSSTSSGLSTSTVGSSGARRAFCSPSPTHCRGLASPVPGLVSAHGPGLQHHQGGLGRCCQAQPPPGRLSHQPHGLCLQHPCQGCPAALLSLVLGPTLLLLQEAEAHQDPLQRLGQGPQLSCLAPSALLLFLLNTKTFFVAQAACSATAALVADWRFHVEKRLLADGHVLLCSTSTDVDRPLLPPEFSHPAFDTLLPYSSWRPWLLPSAHFKISLARYEQGCWVLFLLLIVLSENQGGEARPPTCHRIDVPSCCFSLICAYTHMFTVVDC